jgi:RHS repeat-associated protein
MCCKEGSDYYYFHYNLKGDVVSITDADKEEVAYYEYDAWGNTMTEAGTWSSPYRFSTKEWDYDSSLYYFGARYCDPEVARGTRRYPMGIVDRLNLYS